MAVESLRSQLVSPAFESGTLPIIGTFPPSVSAEVSDLPQQDDRNDIKNRYEKMSVKINAK
jgi:hypothetical protein